MNDALLATIAGAKQRQDGAGPGGAILVGRPQLQAQVVEAHRAGRRLLAFGDQPELV